MTFMRDQDVLRIAEEMCKDYDVSFKEISIQDGQRGYRDVVLAFRIKNQEF